MLVADWQLRCQERWRTIRFNSFHLWFLESLPYSTQGTSKENLTLNLHFVFKDIQISPGVTLGCFPFSNSSIKGKLIILIVSQSGNDAWAAAAAERMSSLHLCDSSLFRGTFQRQAQWHERHSKSKSAWLPATRLLEGRHAAHYTSSWTYSFCISMKSKESWKLTSWYNKWDFRKGTERR